MASRMQGMVRSTVQPAPPLEGLRRLRQEQARLADQFTREGDTDLAAEFRKEADLLDTCIRATEEAIQTAAAATLRQVAGWATDDDAKRDDLYQMADAVGRADAETLSQCCPVCEEVRCDEDCPLEPVRAALGERHAD